MSQEGFKRKLTSIFSADAVGYSRLMGDDEAATVRTLTSYRNVISTLVRQHNGNVIDSPGDNLLAEFISVVDAVQCAVAVQKELKARNDELPENRKMQFRIGINLGDVIQEDERIYGDGVNIAARLEGLAEPGGICISKTAFDQIESKLPYRYDYMGDQAVKNIAKPVGAYRVFLEPIVVKPRKAKEKKSVRRMSIIVGAAIIIVLAIAAGTWHLHKSRLSVEPASVDKMAYPLPERPSIAVLPFDNLSGDSEQDYFSDGMTDDLITDLSKISGLFVMARNSTFFYKGKSFKIKQVAEELGVRYVLEGSIRKVKNLIRINAQLIDGLTGGHLWAERYDGKLEDVFSLQDKITMKIVAALAVKLTADEEKEVIFKGTDNVQAYDAFLQGWAHYVRMTPDDFARAVSYFETAIDFDPNYGRAYAALAATYWESFYRFWHDSLGVTWDETKERAEEYLQKAMEKDPTSLARSVASKMHIARHNYEEAIAETEHALSLDPNNAGSYIAMAYALVYTGKPKDAMDYIKKAMRINPEYPAYYLFVFGLAHFSLEQFAEAGSLFERALERNPENYIALIPLAATYIHIGREKEAKTRIKRLYEIMPIVTLAMIEECPLWQYKNFDDRHRLLSGLEKAGLAKTHYDLLE
jgi:TolB-like protein/class 3 adenylate cyclase